MNESLLLVLCVGCAGLISGLTGFAFALIASGTLLSIRSPVEATALVLVCSILSQAISILRLRAWPPRGTAFAMILPGLVGAPIGIHLLHGLDPTLVKVAIGTFLILYSGTVALLRADYRVGLRQRLERRGHRLLRGRARRHRGPFGRPADRLEPRARLGPADPAGGLPVVHAGDADLGLHDPRLPRSDPPELAADLALALPVVLVSVLAGLSLFARIDQRRFRSIVLALLAVIGLTTTALALPGLLHR